MKCPNCGAQMKEGQLYCEQCGKEIQIVPDFEPELENSIHTTLSNVATEITAPGQTSEEQSHQTQQPKKERRKTNPGRRRLTTVLSAAALLLLVTAGIGIGVSRSPAFQYRYAVRLIEKEQYDAATTHLEKAINLSPNNISYLNRLSGCYYAMEDWEKAAEVCQRIISLEGSNEEAYRRLVLIYEKEGDYDAIDQLIQACSDREIRNLYADYMAGTPEFDPAGDTYYEKQNIKLIGSASGTVYYTLDGSEPTMDSPVYTTPIALESGAYTLRAFYVNQYGVASDVVTQEYYIDVNVPEAPQVLPESGEYSSPVQIEAALPEEGKIYYTTDGTDPDANSQVYESPFWMPAGYSTFSFVVVSPGGITGEVTRRQYTLNLHPVLSTEAALNRLLLHLRDSGQISDIQGNVSGLKGQYRYVYRYPLTVNQNNYYLYREYYQEADGTSNATQNRYVVNYMSGECYRIEQQPDQTYKLYLIEPESGEEETPGT